MTTRVRLGDIVPFPCVTIDAELKDILATIKRCFATERVKSRSESAETLAKLFGINCDEPQNVLPCLSVRSAFDLLLMAAKFEPGSEVIMSAINIPDMAAIVRHHGLVVVPLDVDIETLEPKRALLPSLINERTVLILVAHLFGASFDVDPFIRIARRSGRRTSRNILFVEDCAENFSGMDFLGGSPDSDVVLHSFGVIKKRTCFGGAIATVGDDQLFRRMVALQETFPLQMNSEYLMKLLQYVAIYLMLNVPTLTRLLFRLGKWAKWDYQNMVVQWLRNHGEQEDLMARIRKRPSTALMVTMAQRMAGEDRHHSSLMLADIKIKHYLVSMWLPNDVVVVGSKARVKPNWLFPVLVKNSSNFSAILNRLGVESYTRATQLKAILAEPSQCLCRRPATSTSGTQGNAESSEDSSTCLVPHDAEYLMEHVVYLPIHERVPYNYLKAICEAARVAAIECSALEQIEDLPQSKL